MKRYKLKKDLPTFKAGDIFDISQSGNLVKREEGITDCIIAYSAQTLEKFPNVLKDWFEEIPEKPKTVWDLRDGDECYELSSEGMILYRQWVRRIGLESCREYGNLFLTTEEAEKERTRRQAKQTLLRDTKGFKPSYEWPEIYYIVVYDYSSPGLKSYSFETWSFGISIAFATEADAEASIKTHEKEWKIYLGVDDE